MKTALITGTTRGLGKFLAETFLKRNWRVLTNHHDLREEKTINGLVKDAEVCEIEILINNAARYINNPYTEMKEVDLYQLAEINLMVPMILTKRLWSVLKRNKGMIVNINSLAGIQGSNGESIYCASKHGLKGFSDSIQFDATVDGIRVVNVFLGAMQTDITRHREDFDNLIDPCEVADVIYELCKNRKSLRITDITICRRNY